MADVMSQLKDGEDDKPNLLYTRTSRSPMIHIKFISFSYRIVSYRLFFFLIPWRHYSTHDDGRVSGRSRCLPVWYA